MKALILHKDLEESLKLLPSCVCRAHHVFAVLGPRASPLKVMGEAGRKRNWSLP